MKPKFYFNLFAVIISTIVLFSCGGGSSSNENKSGPTALTYSNQSAVYTVGESIENNVPSVTGTVTDWSVSPELPSGLSINSDTGIISGVPTTEQLASYYTVIASNNIGSVSIVLAIAINDLPPSDLTYSSNIAVYTLDEPIVNNIPSFNGSVNQWSVSPKLPGGLSINTETGVISGAPNTEQIAREYTISASNNYGLITAVISIEINDAAPKDLSYMNNELVLTIDKNMGYNVAKVTGTVTSWTSEPELPIGLNINQKTGAIMGTPLLIQSSTDYIITASNSGGSTTAVVSIAVTYDPPTSLSYYTTDNTYVINKQISRNFPRVTGTITEWSVTPTLPNGLVINPFTGYISGTPDTEKATTEYTITGSNSVGSVSTTIIISVVLQTPGIVYPIRTVGYKIGSSIVNNVPVMTGIVRSLSITPSLPSGLSFDTTTGVISGIPTEESPRKIFTISATNSGGSGKDSIYITVVNEYAAGDSGPSGGTVFYDKGSYSDGWRFLESSPRSIDNVKWNNGVYLSVLPNSSAIGFGQENTTAIIETQGEGDYAAILCDKFSVNGYDDWFLPSIGELNELYSYALSQGNGSYWSSTESDDYDASFMYTYYDQFDKRYYFSHGTQRKNLSSSAMPVRSF